MKRRSLSRLSPGQVAGMYLTGEIEPIDVPDRCATFVLNHLKHLMERELQRKIDALKAVTTCGCGIKWETPGQCWKCEQRKRA